jgi:hypothetical protein
VEISFEFGIPFKEQGGVQFGLAVYQQRASGHRCPIRTLKSATPRQEWRRKGADVEITDIPQQISTALKYSLRSRSSFFFSLFSAALVCGAAYDLSYAFLYTRLFNAKDAHYGPMFWQGLVLFSVVVPVAAGIIKLLIARRQERTFPPNKYGVVIAPFDVVSLDPETLGTSSKLRALDELMTQFFTAQERIIEEEDWSKDFEFRFLPPYAHMHNRRDAEDRLQSMRAVLVIWGQIVQETGKTVRATMLLVGPELNLTMELPCLETKIVATSLKFYALVAAAFSEKAAGRPGEAIGIFTMAKTPAAELDRMTDKGSTSNVAIVDRLIQQLQSRPVVATNDASEGPEGKADGAEASKFREEETHQVS